MSQLAVENKEKEPSSDESSLIESQNQICSAIDNFVHRILDIEDCARQFITAANDSYNNKSNELKNKIEECQKLMEGSSEHTTKIVVMRDLRETIRQIDRHNMSSPVETLEKSLFVNLFSAYDKFVGDIISVLYAKQPNLYKNINKQICLSEVLKFESMEELREAMLDKEIETLRRGSYVEQFKELELKFSLKLTKFEHWPNFIEAAQRRNLFTHCDGIVTKQYVTACTEAGYNFPKPVEIGDQLKIGAKYFFESCRIVTEVGAMLGHTLWRKCLPDDLEAADKHLHTLIFDYLHMEHFPNAILLSKFALNLPKISNDQMDRINTVNYAIALRGIGEKQASKNILDKKDWSASIYDFKLAYAVLTDDYAEAEKLMIKIGPKSDMLIEMSYHDWPLFKEFRESPEFFSGYEKVYGYKYATKLTSLAKEAKNN